MPVKAISVGTSAVPDAFIAAIACGVGEGAVLDRIDPGARRGLDAARAMGVGGDLEAERMGGVDDRLHLGVGEMLAEAARLLREDAAGGGDLDEVGAGARGLADPRRALLGAGAGIAGAERLDHLGAEAGDVAMAADDRDGRAGGEDPRARDDALLRSRGEARSRPAAASRRRERW